MPLFTLQCDLDARAFSLLDDATQCNDQGFNVREDEGGRSRASKDSLKCLAVLGIHSRDASIYR